MAVDFFLHDEVKRNLKARGITLSSIASKLGVSASLVTMVSQGHRTSIPIATAIAAHLGAKPSDIWATYEDTEVQMLEPEK